MKLDARKCATDKLSGARLLPYGWSWEGRNTFGQLIYMTNEQSPWAVASYAERIGVVDIKLVNWWPLR